ncbi:MAG: hypothetical protein K6B72_02065 [Lachnospiraceae bacterium]|nr:hypothetical protein [Lachnospiraceae bacterium]
MKIADSIMQMAASGTYVKLESSGSGIDLIRRETSSSSLERSGKGTSGESTLEKLGSFVKNAAADKDEKKSFTEGFSDLLNNSYTRTGDYAQASSETKELGRRGISSLAGTTSLKDTLFQALFARIFGGSSFRSSILGGTTAGATIAAVSAYEYEDMDFTAQGEAHTEDGRTITFDLRLFMSREFAVVTQVTRPGLASALMDPLVINVGAATAGISTQTFRFDLDADGTEEEVALPTRGSAFLALDKNEDGRIGDGSELFGAMTGDGFGELREYDSDGNGWIDENDEIFSRLRVWYRNGDGKDELVDLKTADVGAIWLGEQQTQFSLTDQLNGEWGRIRSTGIFIKESGGVGTIQHVDLAVGDSREDIVSGMPGTDAAVGGENFVSGYGALQIPVSSLSAKLNGASAGGASDDTESSQVQEESPADRRKRIAEEKAKLKEEAAQRRAEKKRLNEEYAEKMRRHREEEEERVEQLFADRKERRQEAAEAHEEASERRRAFDEEWAQKRAKKPA